jgi:tripartite-type tricarboxylate transporter receptor subunit TctC
MSHLPGFSILRRATLAFLATAAALGATAAGAADAYPGRPVTIIVPYPAGGTTDMVARIVAQRLTESLKQSFIIDNRGGANGIIGMELAGRAEPDGYTLMLNTAGAQTLAPILYKTKVQPLESWEPVSLISTVPFLIVVPENSPAKDLAALVTRAQKGDPPVTASSGSSMITLVTDEFKRAIKAPSLINVPYKGTAPQAQAVLSGEVDMSVDSFVTMPHVKSGKVRPLAVTSAQRVASLPAVPTMEELGYKGMVFGSWAGLLAPKGTPQAIVNQLAAEIQKMVRDPGLQERLKGYDHTPVGNTPAEFTKVITDDHARWQRIVKETNYKIE